MFVSIGPSAIPRFDSTQPRGEKRDKLKPKILNYDAFAIRYCAACHILKVDRDKHLLYAQDRVTTALLMRSPTSLAMHILSRCQNAQSTLENAASNAKPMHSTCDLPSITRTCLRAIGPVTASDRSLLTTNNADYVVSILKSPRDEFRYARTCF